MTTTNNLGLCSTRFTLSKIAKTSLLTYLALSASADRTLKRFVRHVFKIDPRYGGDLAKNVGVDLNAAKL